MKKSVLLAGAALLGLSLLGGEVAAQMTTTQPQPGTTQPGAVQPGAVQPGVIQPGMTGTSQTGIGQSRSNLSATGQTNTGAMAQGEIPPNEALRASKIIGSSVYNDANDSIGKVDDILITADGKAPYAVLSVGGFLGVGSRLVAVPFANLKPGNDDRVHFPNASKDQLNSMPEYHYSR